MNTRRKPGPPPRRGTWMRRTGELVSWTPPDGLRLDGFYAPAPPQAPSNLPLAVFIHGMFSNFYRSPLKLAFLDELPPLGVPVLSINNRGAETGTTHEVFEASLHDLDAAVSFSQEIGRRHVVLIGHSTGCQKALHWADIRRACGLAALVLLAPCDDYAIVRRELGPRWRATIARARARVRSRRGHEIVVGRDTMHFTARRFLSLADPRRREAALFRYDGPMRAFRRLRIPTFIAFGDREPYAVQPVSTMLARLRSLRPDDRLVTTIVQGADHSFHPCESQVARRVADWLLQFCPSRPPNDWRVYSARIKTERTR